MKKILTVILLVYTLNATAQPEMEDGDGTVPVDGGISLLLAAGAAYGIKRFRDHRSR